MIKLEIDEKFEELSNLYDLFENITRIDYVPLEYREEIKKALIKAYKDGNQEFEKIHEKLKRLEKIENLRTTPNALETCLANYMNKCIELEKENQELKMIIDKHTNTIGHNGLQMSYLQEELDSLHQAYNELNQTNEELIKINNQLGKEKEELCNEITLLKNKIKQLKNKKEGK